MQTSFTSEASNPAARIGALLLAIADEFARVDADAAYAALDRLAAAVDERCPRLGGVEDHADAIVDLLSRERFRVARRVAPEDALLDAVLRRREGHPLLIAAVCAEAGGRAGLSVAPIRDGEDFLVGVRHRGRVVAIDPTGERSCPLIHPAWMCAHEVAFGALGQLARLYKMQGRIADAIHAAGLRSALPVSGPFAERLEVEVGALRAQLN